MKPSFSMSLREGWVPGMVELCVSLQVLQQNDCSEEGLPFRCLGLPAAGCNHEGRLPLGWLGCHWNTKQETLSLPSDRWIACNFSKYIRSFSQTAGKLPVRFVVRQSKGTSYSMQKLKPSQHKRREFKSKNLLKESLQPRPLQSNSAPKLNKRVWGGGQEESSSSHPSQDDDTPAKEAQLPASQEQVNRQRGHRATKAAGLGISQILPCQMPDPQRQFVQWGKET